MNSMRLQRSSVNANCSRFIATIFAPIPARLPAATIFSGQLPWQQFYAAGTVGIQEGTKGSGQNYLLNLGRCYAKVLAHQVDSGSNGSFRHLYLPDIFLGQVNIGGQINNTLPVPFFRGLDTSPLIHRFQLQQCGNCIAFVAFAARVNQHNIGAQDIQAIFNASRNDNSSDALYDIFSDIDGVDYFLPPALFASKDAYEAVLDKLFNTIINVGIVSFTMASNYDSTLTATNYLKKDKNYYTILRTHWATISNDIQRIFSDIQA